MKKVCIFFPYPMGDSFLSGGVSKLVIANIVAIRNKYQVSVMAPKDNAKLKEYLEEKFPEVKVELVDFLPLARFVDNKNFIARYLMVLMRICEYIYTQKNVKNAITRLNPDLVHFHGEVTYSYLKYAKNIGAGAIFHASCFRFSKPSFLKDMVVNEANKCADLVLSPTKSIAALFGKGDKCKVLPNPIISVNASKVETAELEKEVLEYNGLKLLFVGRICRVKQIHYMLQAINIMTENERQSVRFYIIGQPNLATDKLYQEEMKMYINDNGLSRNVIFLGYKSNVDMYMNVMDIGVLLSESEAISMAGIEYLYNKLPIIAFNNPGLDELVKDGYNGILAKDGDIHKLKEIVMYLKDNPDKLEVLKHNAYNDANETYSMEAFSSRLSEYYQDIIR